MGTYANFYNSDNGDRVYDADSFSEWLRPFFKTGVFNGELQVMASSGMEVIVDTGNAFIEGKLKKFDSQTTLTVEQASANSTRIDSVICRRNDTDRDFTLMIVKGTTVAPLPVRENGIYDIVLAHITVPASAVEIKQENIADTRMNADICGWVVSNVEEVDFDQVTAQWADYIANFEADELQAFNEWFDTIKGQLSTDQAGSLQLQIDEQANKIATNTANISANKADIDANSADITSLQQTTSKNTSDIATNKANIDNVKCGEYGAGKNLINVVPREATVNGLTVKVSDNIITVNGTNTGIVNIAIYFVEPVLLNGTYTISGGISQIQLYLSDTIDGPITAYYGTDNKTITVANKYARQLFVYIDTSKSLTFNNQEFKIQLEKGSTATDYEPYIKSLNRLNEDKADKSDIAKLKQPNTVTLGTSWTQDTTNGYYTQTVAFDGITSKDNPTVDVNLSGTLANMQSQQEEWGKILKIETLDNTLKFYVSEPTTVSLSVMVKGV